MEVLSYLINSNHRLTPLALLVFGICLQLTGIFSFSIRSKMVLFCLLNLTDLAIFVGLSSESSFAYFYIGWYPHGVTV